MVSNVFLCSTLNLFVVEMCRRLRINSPWLEHLENLVGRKVDEPRQAEATIFPSLCLKCIRFGSCRLCTRAQRRAGRSTARRRTQMGSASVPWSHRPRTCVTETHAAGNFASSWRRWQLSITHSLWDTTVTPRRHTNCHTAARSCLPPSATCRQPKCGVSLPLPFSYAEQYDTNQESLFFFNGSFLSDIVA